MTPFGEGLWNENDQLFGAGYHNCSLGFIFSSDQTGTYRVTLYATYAPDFGELAIALLIGGTPANTDAKFIDLYRPIVTPTGPMVLGNLPLVKGEEAEIIIIVSGKNQFSTDYKFGLDYLKLECLKDC
jgi:hypothetical protein